MRRASFEALVVEAEAADVTGWGFGWLAGRATEERPLWGYAGLLAERLGAVRSALDVDTGGGEVLARAVSRSWRPWTAGPGQSVTARSTS